MKTRRLLAVLMLLSISLIGSFSTQLLAQETPTDRPFPVIATRTPAPTSVQPTDRPFPAAASRAATATVAATATETAESTEEGTAELTTGDALATALAAQATAAQLSTENKSLQDQLDAAQADKGATLFAIVIVVIGALLAFAVFFGLRRSGK